MLREAIKSFQVGFRRRWLPGVVKAFGVAGVVWLVTEITDLVSSSAEHWVKNHGSYYIAFVFGAAAVAFVRQIYEVRSVSFNLPTTNTKIEIRYGDLFEQTTDWLIGVNEFFDSELGQVVSKTSLHGQPINNVYNGDCNRFRNLVDDALIGAKSTDTQQRFISPKLRYEMGTTAILANGPPQGVPCRHVSDPFGHPQGVVRRSNIVGSAYGRSRERSRSRQRSAYFHANHRQRTVERQYIAAASAEINCARNRGLRSKGWSSRSSEHHCC